MEVALAKQMGFCVGVRRAVELVEKATEEKKPLWILGSLVHNPQVVRHFEERGAHVAETLADAVGDTVVIPSHGATPEVLEEAHRHHARVIDATCPIVKAIELKVKQLAQAGFMIVVFGDKGHAETNSILGWAGSNAHLISNDEELKGLPRARRIALISQTTQSIAAYQEVVRALTETKLSEVTELSIQNTICNATYSNQEAAVELAKRVETMIVVGGRDSANTRRLAEVCRKAGVNAFHIENADQIDPAWFPDKQALVGVTAGASTPDWVVQEVVERLIAI